MKINEDYIKITSFINQEKQPSNPDLISLPGGYPELISLLEMIVSHADKIKENDSETYTNILNKLNFVTEQLARFRSGSSGIEESLIMAGVTAELCNDNKLSEYANNVIKQYGTPELTRFDEERHKYVVQLRQLYLQQQDYSGDEVAKALYDEGMQFYSDVISDLENSNKSNGPYPITLLDVISGNMYRPLAPETITRASYVFEHAATLYKHTRKVQDNPIQLENYKKFEQSHDKTVEAISNFKSHINKSTDIIRKNDYFRIAVGLVFSAVLCAVGVGLMLTFPFGGPVSIAGALPLSLGITQGLLSSAALINMIRTGDKSSSQQVEDNSLPTRTTFTKAQTLWHKSQETIANDQAKDSSVFSKVTSFFNHLAVKEDRMEDTASILQYTQQNTQHR